jgi:hypothetical protein
MITVTRVSKMNVIWRPVGVALVALAFAAAGVAAQHAPYAGLDEREISTLSEADIAALEAGEGWGLALPAELNGYPGPAHVLDHAEALGLSAAQRQRVEAVFDAMRAEARRLGTAYIDAERGVDALFRDGDATPEALAAATARSGAALAALRTVHLAAHLEVTPLLTRHQRHLYTQLRGYGGAAHGHHSGH